MTRGAILIDDEKADAALADFDEALSKAPKSTAALIGRGVALGMLGRHDEAIRDFNQALILDPSYWGDTHPGATSTIATAILTRL